VAKRLAPRDCIVHSIELLSGGKAEVRYRCSDDRGQKTYRYGNVTSNYPHKIVRARSVSFRGVTISGPGARMGFVVSPAGAVCHKERGEIRCSLVGDTSLPSLQGLPSRRRRR